jgi:hypothetical protein
MIRTRDGAHPAGAAAAPVVSQRPVGAQVAADAAGAPLGAAGDPSLRERPAAQPTSVTNMLTRGSTARDGLTVGLLGAAVTSGWMIVVDALAGHPFRTPRLLGAALARAGPDAVLGPVAVYFTLHLVAMTGIAIGLTALVHRGDRTPSVLLLAATAFTLFQFLYTGLVAVLAQSQLGPLAWVQFSGGGVLAAFVTAGALYRLHPAVRRQFARAADDSDA